MFEEVKGIYLATRKKHDQLFNARSSVTSSTALALPAGSSTAMALAAHSDDDELAVIIKDACSRELMDLGLSFNSLNIKAVLSEVKAAQPAKGYMGRYGNQGGAFFGTYSE